MIKTVEHFTYGTTQYKITFKAAIETMITPVLSIKFNTTSTPTIGFMSAIVAADSIETMPAALSKFFLAWNYLKNIKHSVIITKCCEKTNTIGNLSCQNV